MRRITTLLVLALCVLGLKSFSQGLNIGESSVNGSFQVDAQYYGIDDQLGITEEYLNGKRMGINGFGKVNYTLGNFSAGIRYEACLTPLAGFDARSQGLGLANGDANLTIVVGSPCIGKAEALRTGIEACKRREASLIADACRKIAKRIVHFAEAVDAHTLAV